MPVSEKYRLQKYGTLMTYVKGNVLKYNENMSYLRYRL